MYQTQDDLWENDNLPGLNTQLVSGRALFWSRQVEQKMEIRLAEDENLL